MIIAILLVAAVLSVPYVNEHYFHIKNLSEMRREAGNRFAEVSNLQAMGQAKAARDSLRSLIEYFSQNNDEISVITAQLGMFQLAANYKQNAISKSDFESAIYEFDKLLKKYPNTMVAEQVFYMIAKCYIEMGDIGHDPKRSYARAIENLEKIERNRPESMNFPKYRQAELKPGTYFNIDRGKVKEVNRDLSRQLYTRAQMMREMATDTTQVKAQLLSDVVLLIGQCYAKLGQGDKAREQYQLILNFFQESDLVDDAQKLIGDSYEEEANQLMQKAEAETNAAAKEELRQKAMIQYNNAITTYLKFINVYHQSDLISKVSIKLGGVYFKVGESKKAYDVFSKAINSIKVIEDQARVQLDIGNYYFEEKKWDDAIESYAKVLQNYSTTEYAANAQYLLASCYEAKGDTLESIKAYNDVCENFRSSAFYPGSAFKIGKYYIDQKNYGKAQQFLRQSISRFPDSPVAAQTQYLLGRIYMYLAEGVDSSDASMKYRLAIEEFDKLISQYDQARDWVEKSTLAIGECYMKLGLKEQARATLGGLKSETALVEKYRILGVEGSDSSIVNDYVEQFKALTDDQAKAQILIEIGRKLKGEEMGLTDSAIATFNQVIGLAQDTVTRMTAFGELADCYIKKGDYKRARAIFKDEILDNPRCEEARAIQTNFRVAESYLRDKMYPDAIAAFTKFIEKNPAHALTSAAVYLLGKSYSQNGEYTKARDMYNKIFTQFDSSDQVDGAGLGYVEALEGEGKHKEAITYGLEFMKKHPGMPSAPNFYFKIAEIYRVGLEDNDAAIEYLQKVLKFSDSYLLSASAYQLGSLYAKRGEDAKAIEAYEQVKKTDVEYFRAAQGEIGAIKAKTDPEGAIQNYARIESSSDDVADKVVARMGIGDVYVAQKKFMDAVESYRIVYEQYTTAEPDLRAAAIIKLIEALNNAEKTADVIKWADRMIRDFPDSKFTINAYYFKANAFYAQKDYRKSRDVFKQVMELDSSGVLAEVAQYQRAECLLSLKDQANAVKEFNFFMQAHPKSQLVANALFQIGTIEWGNENWSVAKKFYTRVLTEYPDFPMMCWTKNYLAFCYDKEGTWRKAKDLYEDVRTGGACDREAKEFAKKQIQSINVKH